MKKLIFTNLPLQPTQSFNYKAIGNSSIEYGKKISYCINSVLAKTLKKGDKVKVVLLKKIDLNGNCHKHERAFKKELNLINKNIGASIKYKVIETPYKETRDIHESILLQMSGEIEDNVEITADITFGPKPLPIILFNVLTFAEKFCGASVKNIIYGKVDFDKGNPKNPEIFDITPLYYLNSLNSIVQCKNSVQAKKILKKLIKR